MIMDKKFHCKNVVASCHTVVNMSRHALLKWINDTLGLKVDKVENLCSGAVYCQLMDMLFPGCVSLKKVKFNSNQTTEFWANFKQLQLAFKNVHCEKNIPIDLLIKGRFQENFEFLQWFKRFWDANGGQSPSSSKSADAKPGTSGVHSRPIATIMPVSKQAQAQAQAQAQVQAQAQALAQAQAQAQAQAAKLRSEIAELESRAEKMQQEKDFFFRKLRNIEILCTSQEAAVTDKESLVSNVLAELYATEEEYEVENEEEEDDDDDEDDDEESLVMF